MEDNPDMNPEVTAKAKATVAPYRGDNSWGFFGAGKLTREFGLVRIIRSGVVLRILIL